MLDVIITLIVIGVLMWILNIQLGQWIQQPYLKIINVVVLIMVILWLLHVFLGYGNFDVGAYRYHR
jgi:hypothetical protein